MVEVRTLLESACSVEKVNYAAYSKKIANHVTSGEFHKHSTRREIPGAFWAVLSIRYSFLESSEMYSTANIPFLFVSCVVYNDSVSLISVQNGVAWYYDRGFYSPIDKCVFRISLLSLHYIKVLSKDTTAN